MYAPFDYKSDLTNQKDSSKLFYLAINSTACYLLAYLLMYTLNQLSTSLIAASLFIKSVVYYHRIDFRVAADFWTPPRVIYTFLSGPLACLVMGIVLQRIYRYAKKSPGNAKLFLLWAYLHAFNLFFGAYVAGVISHTGFRYVSNYMQVPEKAEFAIAFFCLIAMFVFGYFATRQFLQISVSQSLIQKFSRRLFILCTVIIPWMLGSAILILAKAPKITLNEMIVFLMMFTIVVPVSIIQRNFQEVNLVKQNKAVGIDWTVIGVTLTFLILFRSVFEYGLSIGSWLKS